MYLEGITICVNYSDFLAWTLPAAKHQFDRLVVVTSTTDLATQRLCEFHQVECVATDVFYENGARFNKAKGINAGLARLSKKGWVLHFDSDIYLPPLFRSTLHPLNLDPHYLYGFDRLMCNSFADWFAFWQAPDHLQENGIYVHAHNTRFAIGTRVAHYGHPDGYVPIGFGQLWNVPASGIDHYPDEHQDAGRSDMLFAKCWARNRRSFVPEVLTIHLESEKLTTMGANWSGRTTRIFGPDPTTDPTTALAVPVAPPVLEAGYHEPTRDAPGASPAGSSTEGIMAAGLMAVGTIALGTLLAWGLYLLFA